ncbi:hypothetical protein FA15DRAFT_694594 [Coprinopsis marcescibilis]|uniref:Ricin B lectin domain-containing protein n=1 Tax=Coprinopsis marcescibilis TaxID=230819 RepID=A0A5C3KVB2_COPMA|nr:hypothetical protein FA15DRAFT_694594 [Coprinopsis marcescibilis]
MPTQLEDGKVYRIVSLVSKGVVELHERTRAAVVNEPNGSQWQQWKAIKVDEHWRFESVAASGIYLGIDRSKKAAGGVIVVGTPNRGSVWHLKCDEDRKHQNAIKLFIPYTRNVLDVVSGSVESTKIHLFNSHNGANQSWILDQNIEPATPCVNGRIYYIQNVQTETVAYFESHTGNVRGYHYSEGRNQLWEAILADLDESLWSFKNILNGRYLAIGGDIAEQGQSIIVSEKPFRWKLIPNALNSEQLELHVPNVDLSLDIKDLSRAPGAEIVLSQPSRERLWRFEKVNIPNQNLPLWAQEYPGAG